MAKLIEVPGIDDCDLLFTLTSRNGKDSVYIRCQEVRGQCAQQSVSAGTATANPATTGETKGKRNHANAIPSPA